MAKIFISYRIVDSLPVAMKLYEALSRRYGEGNIFWDKERIEGGDKWSETIDEGLRTADYVLVLIGPKWMSEIMKRRGETREDVVVREISTALKRDACVIPVYLYPKGSDDPFVNSKLNFLKENYFYEIADLADLQGIPLAYDVVNLDEEIERLKSEAVKTPEAKTTLKLDEGQIQRLIRTIERQPIYDALLHGAQSIVSELRSLSIDSQTSQWISALTAELRQKAMMHKPPKEEQVKASTSLEQDNLIYQDSLLSLIEKIGNPSLDVTDPQYRFVKNKLDQMFEFACRELALTDRELAFTDDQGGKDLRRSHGYLGLLGMIADVNTIDGGAKSNRFKIGRRALAYYLEYHDAEKVVQPQRHQEAVAQYLKDAFGLAVRGGKLDLAKSQIGKRMFAHTWREFISLEALGAILVSVIFSLAFANHTSISRQLIAQGESFAEANAPMACWLPSGQNSSLPLCSGLIVLDFVVWGCVGFAAYGVLKKHSVALALTSAALAILIIMINFGLANNLSGASLGTQLEFSVRFLIQFIVAGLLTTPATLMLLGALGLSSVLSKERRVRASPQLNFSFAVISSALGMALIMFLFAAVVEKSRSQAGMMIAIGLCWGVWLGLIIYLVFERNAKHINQGKPIVPFYWQRLSSVALASVIFGLFLGIAGLWPREVEFFSLPQMPQMMMTDALAQVAAQANGLGQLLRVVMLSAWIGLAIFIGVEILTEKMMSSGEVKPRTENSANPSDTTLQTAAS